MAKVFYTQAVKDAVVKAALVLRAEGKSWSEALKSVCSTGYKGGVSGLQKLVRGSIRNEAPAAKRVLAGKKKARQSEKFAAVSFNAFTESKGRTRGGSSAPERTNTILRATRKTVFKSSAETYESFVSSRPVLRDGVRFGRPISLFHGPFIEGREGELQAWSQILGREEALCIRNTHDVHPRGADVLIDCELNPPGSALTVLFVSAENPQTLTPGGYEVNTRIQVQRRWDGTAFVAIRDLPPGAMLVLTNSPERVLA